MQFTNQLVHETSPYLLQHAHNPVNWYPWTDEALQKAREEDKPILISIGYAACHWCHVMEKESFEDITTARLMNENFINIKIDREERPDLDHIYMDAVQAISGSGGWPLNVFLTPQAKPFYGGTYFPPQRAFNRPSWRETLMGIIQAFNERRHEVDAQAENLTNHLLQSNVFGINKKDTDEVFTTEKINQSFESLMKSADEEWGGFGKEPKFPQSFSIQFLLRFNYVLTTIRSSNKSDFSDNLEKNKADAALKQALLSLDKMIEGGIYDQVRGGFARYSTDKQWQVPHFEKMLYDNALLISVLSEAYQHTQKERYKEVIEETMEFIQNELVHPAAGFYAALDADSEGVEGKFYIWSYKEVTELVGKDAAIFCDYYDITEEGNLPDHQAGWLHNSIPRVLKPLKQFAEQRKINPVQLKEILEKGKKELLNQRSKRIRPLLDDKVILGWNALMNTSCSKAFAATGNEKYKLLAIANMEFLLKNFSMAAGNGLYHTWKNNKAKFPAFLDDYAFLIQALLHLQEITANKKWLMKAKELTTYVIDNFSDDETAYFFYTPSGQQDVIIRKKEMGDGALPSGNSVMAYNLWQLSILLDKKDWKQKSIEMVSNLGKAIGLYPTSFGIWACLLLEIVNETNEICLMGKDFFKLHMEILRKYIPHKILMASNVVDSTIPLLANKSINDRVFIYLCSNYTCKQPVESTKDLIALINNPHKQHKF
jgi:uncharacterized protein YyaL (SSP411 family)